MLIRVSSLYILILQHTQLLLFIVRVKKGLGKRIQAMCVW